MFTPIQFLLDGGSALLLFTVAWVAGNGLCRLLLAGSAARPVDRAFMALGAGLVLQAAGTWGLGMVGTLSLPALLGLWAIFVAFGWQETRAQATALRAAADVSDFLRAIVRPRPLFIVFVLGLGCDLIYNYSPVLLDDSAYSYLGLPLTFVYGAPLAPVQGNFHSYFPQGVEMLYTQAMLLGSPLAGKMLNWFFLLFDLLLLARIFFLKDKDQGAATLLALVITMPWVTALVGTGKIDLGSQFFLLAAFLAFLLWEEKGSVGRLLLVSLLIGAHAATKYTGVYGVATFGVLLVGTGMLRAGLWGGIRTGLLYSCTAMLPVAPFLARNFLLTGNPVFPAQLGGFPVEPYLQMEAYSATANLVFSGLLDRVIYYFREYCIHGVTEGTGPVWPAFLPLVFVTMWRDKAFLKRWSAVVLSAVLFFSLFMLHAPNTGFTRFLAFPIFLISLPLCARLNRLMDRASMPALSARALLWIGLLFPGLFLSTVFASKRVGYISGVDSKATFLQRRWKNCEDFAMYDYIHAHVPVSKKIFFAYLNMAPIYHYPRHKVYALGYFTPEFYRESSTAQAFAALRKNDFAYILTCPSPERPKLADGTLDFPQYKFSVEWFKKGEKAPVEVLFENTSATLYKIYD